MKNANTSRGKAKGAALSLLAYCRANDWAGHDPYDALNSRIFTRPIAHGADFVMHSATKAIGGHEDDGVRTQCPR
jgi:hypothetical protein